MGGRVSKYLGHVKRMRKERFTLEDVQVDVEAKKDRGRPCLNLFVESKRGSIRICWWGDMQS